MYLVGDADRERGLALLRRHYADGRLTAEELDERVEHAARARTTTDLRVALRDLPGGVALSTLAPRLGGFRETPAGAEVVRRTVRAVVAAALLATWMLTSIVALASLGIAMLVVGASSALAAAFTLAWVAVSWLFWRVWRAGSRRRA
jgi:hypothetical protein